MTENNELNFEKIADFAEGRLSDEESRRTARLIEESDETTRAEARWLAAFVKVSGRISIDAPPERVGRDLEAAFAGRFAPAAEPEKPGLMERILATLTFDSDAQAAFGVRSASASAGESQRQISYETGIADISVSIQPRPGSRFDLLGQVLPLDGDDDPEGFTVQLVRPDDTEVALENADDLGEFAFEGIPGGSYSIVVATGETEISIPVFIL